MDRDARPNEEAARPGANATSPFPGWIWAWVALAFPIAGLVGGAVSGPVDAPLPALVGGLLTGAGLGAVQWLVAKDVFGSGPLWIATSGVAYGIGLMAGAAVVGYHTDIGSLAAMGAISGLFLGAGQGLALAQQGRERLAAAWAAAMPVLLAVGWVATTLIGVDVDQQFTIFGAMGAILFTLLSGLVLARFRPTVRRVAA